MALPCAHGAIFECDSVNHQSIPSGHCAWIISTEILWLWASETPVIEEDGRLPDLGEKFRILRSKGPNPWTRQLSICDWISEHRPFVNYGHGIPAFT
jgi:hypothetical protein